MTHLFKLFCFFSGDSLLFPPLPEPPSEVPTLLMLPAFLNFFVFPEEDAEDSASALSLLLKRPSSDVQQLCCIL